MAPISYLKRLPVELRVKVFLYALTQYLPTTIEESTGTIPALITALRSNSKATSLYQEALHVYYRTHRFQLNQHNFEGIQRLSPNTKNSVCHLVVKFSTVCITHPKFKQFVQKHGLRQIIEGGPNTNEENYEIARRNTAFKRILPPPSHSILESFRGLISLELDAVDFPQYTFNQDFLTRDSHPMLLFQEIKKSNGSRRACRFFWVQEIIHKYLKECTTLRKLTIRAGDQVKFDQVDTEYNPQIHTEIWLALAPHFTILQLDSSWVDGVNSLAGVKGKLRSITDISPSVRPEQGILNFQWHGWEQRTGAISRETGRCALDWFWEAAKGRTLGGVISLSSSGEEVDVSGTNCI